MARMTRIIENDEITETVRHGLTRMEGMPNDEIDFGHGRTGRCKPVKSI
jgi:hypothetical protein